MSQNAMEHERHRFSYMTNSQLRTRLSRISKSDKLLNFARMAEETGKYGLAALARDKFERLFNYRPVGMLDTKPTTDDKSQTVMKPKKKKRVGRKGQRVIRV